MRTFISLRWLVVAVSAAMLLAVVAACSAETVEVPGETVVVEKEVIKEVQVPGETVVVEKEVVKTVEVPGETVVVEKEVVKTVEVPGQTVVVEKEVVKEVEGDRYVRNVWGELVEKPQHGGKIPIGVPMDLAVFDPWFADWTIMYSVRLGLDRLGQMNWALSPDEYDWSQAGYLTVDVVTGALAESWEQPDLNTYIFNIRKGVHWQDKPPMNGRELTADDVEFTWHRQLGLGSGFTEPSPYAWQVPELRAIVESVTATDEWTVEVKTSSFSFSTLDMLLFANGASTYIQPPEVIKEYGDMKDWRHFVGTGPFEITDLVPASSLTYTKNPNYWQYDPLFPELGLRLPYADEFKFFVMPDVATRVAALRTGKIAHPAVELLPLAQIKSLQRTNPELVTNPVASSSHGTPGFLMDQPPFDDVNVRIAMQKAINLHEIASTYYKGGADPTPWGAAPSGAKGMYVPFDEWPEEVKWEYEYDPEAAEKLLDEAGYPRAAAGIRFTTNWDVCPPWGADPDLAQLASSYWDEIGVDVYINVIGDGALCGDRQASKAYEGMSQNTVRHKQADPRNTLASRFYKPGENDRYGVRDSAFDALVDKTDAATDREEYLKLVREMDMHFIKQMWTLYLPPIPDRFAIHQPWLKGWRGELGGSEDDFLSAFPYMWVDKELKKEMGH